MFFKFMFFRDGYDINRVIIDHDKRFVQCGYDSMGTEEIQNFFPNHKILQHSWRKLILAKNFLKLVAVLLSV